MPAPQQSIVILGGFLITQEAYQPMRQTLADLSGLPLERVELVAVGRLEWLLTVWPFAWPASSIGWPWRWSGRRACPPAVG